MLPDSYKFRIGIGNKNRNSININSHFYSTLPMYYLISSFLILKPTYLLASIPSEGAYVTFEIPSISSGILSILITTIEDERRLTKIK